MCFKFILKHKTEQHKTITTEKSVRLPRSLPEIVWTLSFKNYPTGGSMLRLFTSDYFGCRKKHTNMYHDFLYSNIGMVHLVGKLHFFMF